MNLIIQGQTQSIDITLTKYIRYPVTASVNSIDAIVSIINNRKCIIDGQIGWSSIIRLTFLQLQPGVYPYSVTMNYVVIASGDITIIAPQPLTEVKTINNQSIKGSGNITVGGGSFEGTLDDVPNGTTYKRTTEAEKNSYAAKVDPVTGKALSTNDLTDILKGYYDAAYAALHSHSNLATLANITEAFTIALKSAYDGAVTNSHTHSNITTLNSIEQAFTTALKSTYDGYAALIAGKTDIATVKLDSDIASAISFKHSNATDHSHSNITTLNAIQEALTTALKASYDGAVSASHTHANSVTLAAIEQALTSALKTAYDGAVTHAGSSHAPSNAQKNSDITKAEIEEKLTGELTSHSHALAIYPFFNSVYRTILDSTGSHIAAKAAGTYGIAQGNPLAITGIGTLYSLNVIYLDSSDYPTIDGKAAKLRVRCVIECNDVAPFIGTFVVGLHPVTRPAVSGGAGVCIYTIGTAVSGSTVTGTNLAADSQNNLVGSDFVLPVNGFYVLAVVTNGTMATNSHCHISASLQIRNN